MQKTTNRIGETATAKNGQAMTIIAYRNNRDIDVQFSDKTVVLHKRYDHFLNGTIYNPNFGTAKSKINERIGLTKKMNNGLTAKIIDYKGNKHITVEFENGIIKQGKWSEFQNGTLTTMLLSTFIPTKKRIGMKVVQNNGEEAELIEYRGSASCTVRFNDGTIRDTTWNNFYKEKCIDKDERIKNGKINNQALVGTSYKNRLGLTYKIIKVETSRNITIRFDIDGSIKQVTLSQIKYGKDGSGIAHPLFTSNKVNGFEYKCIIKNKNNVYFKVKHEDGFEGIMTPQEMIMYNR